MATCAHCSRKPDTTEYTLARCEAWQTQRIILMELILAWRESSNNISLNDISKWKIFKNFSKSVIKEKEQAERDAEERTIK